MHSGYIQEWLGIKEVRLLGTRLAAPHRASRLKGSHLVAPHLHLAVHRRLASGQCHRASHHSCRRGCPLLAFPLMPVVETSHRPGFRLAVLPRVVCRRRPWVAVRDTLRTWCTILDRIQMTFLGVSGLLCVRCGLSQLTPSFLRRPKLPSITIAALLMPTGQSNLPAWMTGGPPPGMPPPPGAPPGMPRMLYNAVRQTTK